MGLLSIFKDKDDASAAADPEAGEVLAARVRARRRLIGATLLLAVGVLGFPLLFETQPRPVPVDIPIEIPRKENAPALVLPSKRSGPSTAPVPMEAQPETATDGATGVSKAESAAPRDLAPVPAVTASAPVVGAEARPAAAVAPASGASRQAAQSLDAQRAQALLEGKSVAPSRSSEPASARVVVQVGAYTDADKLRDVRHRVEQLGMKTYTQVVDAEGTRRTRVRVGPFGTRQDAESAAARIKAAGLPAAILVL